ncbi:hypothetical protein ACFUMH_19065, partial [Cellulomonas sp. NPDC057328]|uniref:hypothetical protein n=1 Tax=Cellulomonas sp. NPDC057328 TaxID=3346101 RepID=UPI00363CCEAB
TPQTAGVVEHRADDVARTDDGRYVVVRGRRWRATDPAMPADVAAVLRRELMSARRAVGAALRADDPDAERAARDRVQAAKLALGERGTPWWEQSPDERRARWAPLVRALGPGPAGPADGLSPGSPSRT